MKFLERPRASAAIYHIRIDFSIDKITDLGELGDEISLFSCSSYPLVCIFF
jgi:hypothetical protein